MASPRADKPVPLVLAQRAKVARALEHEHLVLVLRRVERKMHAEAGKAEVAKRRLVELVLAVVEELGIEADLARRAARNLGDARRPVVERARVEELDLERQVRGAPQRSRRLEADVAILVVRQILQRLRQVAPRRLVRLRRKRGTRAWRRPRSRTRRRLRQKAIAATAATSRTGTLRTLRDAHRDAFVDPALRRHLRDHRTIRREAMVRVAERAPRAIQRTRDPRGTFRRHSAPRRRTERLRAATARSCPRRSTRRDRA